MRRGFKYPVRSLGKRPGYRVVGILVNVFAALYSLVAPLPAHAVEVVEQVVDQKYPVNPGATLSIHNTDGSIRIYAANISEISMVAVKKAYTEERLKEIGVDVTSDGKNVVIETKFPPKKSGWSLSDRSGTVEYTLIVPQTIQISRLELENGEVLVEGLQGGSATAHLTNGWLAGHNCFGDLNLSVANGRLDVAYDWWEGKQFTASATTQNASIRVILPTDASIHVTASAGMGKITNALLAAKPPPTPTQMLDTVLGAGESAWQLKAADGNIRIDKSY